MITISEYRKKFKKDAEPKWEEYTVQKIVYTDLDGTLIDHHTYSYADSLESINLLKNKKIPIVICTSKTRTEIEKYRKELNIKDPFISENGGAIFIPNNYFDFDFNYDEETHDYKIIELGTPIKFLKYALNKIKKKGYKLTAFSDMSPEELSEDSGLTIEDATDAKKREYDEAFKIDDERTDEILKLIEKEGYNHTAGGRYCHILSGNDKGKAVLILKELFSKKYKEEEKDIQTIGLGDSSNDIPMLQVVDVPILVKNPSNPELDVDFPVKKTKLPGPKGWNNAIKELFLQPVK
ncbi:MAG: mannosyl-3-phosphoglycerate phosphatase [Candidatus Aenigmarchaeota archaeon]|nr:mannosyl-3-phosphoglycerate phosphatase [Candidatus Aenigmarchaeota archaeon]